MSERDMRGRLIRAVPGAFAVENPCLPGTPDVCSPWGWWELKWLRAWPKRPDTPVRFEHWTPQQVYFHKWWSRVGGRSCVIVQCRRDWLGFTGPVAAELLGKLTRDEMPYLAKAVSGNGLTEEFICQMMR